MMLLGHGTYAKENFSCGVEPTNEKGYTLAAELEGRSSSILLEPYSIRIPDA